EGDQWKTVPIGELHRTHRLPIALGVGHPEASVHTLVSVTAFLVTDHHDRPTAESAEARDDRGVVPVVAISVQLEPVVDQPPNIVEGMGPVFLPGEQDRMPDLLVARLRNDSVELLLEAPEVALESRA